MEGFLLLVATQNSFGCIQAFSYPASMETQGLWLGIKAATLSQQQNTIMKAGTKEGS